MEETSFYDADALQRMGFASIGEDVCISRFARFYDPGRISLGSHSRIDDFCVLSASGGAIHIGSHVHVACYAALFGGGGIEIADFCNISSRVAVYSQSDDFSGRSLTNPTIPAAFKPGYVQEPVLLERHVLLGTASTVLPGVRMGEGSVLGAHSFAQADCEAWQIYAGCPARRIKPREKDILQLERAFLDSR